MSQVLTYSPEFTRKLYKCVALETPGLLNTLVDDIAAAGGSIGNAQYSDIEIREGSVLLCQRHKLNDNTAVYMECPVTQLAVGHAWDADGVWLPTKEGA